MRLFDRVAEVNAVSEREVIAAASAVERIVERARGAAIEQVAIARTLGGGSESGIEATLARQSRLVSSWQAGLLERLRKQEEIAIRSVAHVQSIDKASAEISRLAFASRILALNVRIEAAHATEHARGLGAVATEMQRLSLEIAAANKLVAQLAEALSATVPVVAQQAQEISESVVAFSVDIAASSREVEQETAALRSMARQSMERADALVQDVVGSSHEVLSHLQFQDVAAQGLRRLDFATEELIQEIGQEPLLADVLDLGAAPGLMEIGGDKAVDADNAGDVMLF